MEERGGFEPPIPVPRDNGFQDRRIRPLCHLSIRLFISINDADHIALLRSMSFEGQPSLVFQSYL